METAVIVGYLVAFLTGATKRFADRRVDDIFEDLYQRVKHKLGGDNNALNSLKGHALNGEAQHRTKVAIERASREDHAFAAALTRLQEELDNRGARQLLIYAPGSDMVAGINNGVMVRNGVFYTTNYRARDDLTEDPAWVKVAFTVGMLLAIAGFGLFGYSFFTEPLNPYSWPPGIVRAAVVFFAGLAVLGVAQVGHSTGPPRSGSRGRY